MILTNEQIKFCQSNNEYTGAFLQQSFGYTFFQTNVSPVGNVVLFESCASMGRLKLPKSLFLCGELMNVSAFGAVCFCRLYLMQLGNLLSEITNKDWFLNSDCLFMEDKQACLSFVNQVKNTALFHIILPLEENSIGLQPLTTTEDNLKNIKENSISIFNILLRDTYLQTRRDNF